MNKRTAAILIAIVVVIGAVFIGTNRYKPMDDKADEFSQGLMDRFGVFDFANREKSSMKDPRTNASPCSR